MTGRDVSIGANSTERESVCVCVCVSVCVCALFIFIAHYVNCFIHALLSLYFYLSSFLCIFKLRKA
ncbi:hypothetical protein KUTeg_000755, partial [Tegillarca granosa]